MPAFNEELLPIAIQMANRIQVPRSSCIIRYTLTNMLMTGRKGSSGTCSLHVKNNLQVCPMTEQIGLKNLLHIC